MEHLCASSTHMYRANTVCTTNNLIYCKCCQYPKLNFQRKNDKNWGPSKFNMAELSPDNK